MLSSEVFAKVGGYCTDRLRQPPEDYELWSRVARQFEVANIPEVLLVYREVHRSMSRDGVNPFIDRLVTISAENLAWIVGQHTSDQHCVDIAALIHGAYPRLSSRPDLKAIRSYLLEAADKVSTLYAAPKEILRRRACHYFSFLKFRLLAVRYGALWANIVFTYDRLRRV